MSQSRQPLMDGFTTALLQAGVGCLLLAYGLAHDGPNEVVKLMADVNAWSAAVSEADYASDN